MRRDCTGNDQETQVHKETNGLREQPPTLFIFLLLLFPNGNLTDGGHGLLHEGLNRTPAVSRLRQKSSRGCRVRRCFPFHFMLTFAILNDAIYIYIYIFDRLTLNLLIRIRWNSHLVRRRKKRWWWWRRRDAILQQFDLESAFARVLKSIWLSSIISTNQLPNILWLSSTAF